MGGHIDSLNVAVAAGVLVYEMRRQQIQQGRRLHLCHRD